MADLKRPMPGQGGPARTHAARNAGARVQPRARPRRAADMEYAIDVDLADDGLGIGLNPETTDPRQPTFVGWRGLPVSPYSDLMNLSHVSAGTLSVTPSRSVVSRTITPLSLATSTHCPPFAPL
jgi:hypothetical protein